MTHVQEASTGLDRVLMSMTVEQAHALRMALSVLGKLSLGQIEVVNALVDAGGIAVATGHRLRPDDIHAIAVFMRTTKTTLGLRSDEQVSPDADQVHLDGKRSIELHAALSRALAAHGSSGFSRSDHFGLTRRLTADPLPEIVISRSPARAAS